jgi:hypothetical protein
MIRVLIVDDPTIVRTGLKAFLTQTDDVQVAGEADSGLEALREGISSLEEEIEPGKGDWHSTLDTVGECGDQALCR